MPDTFAVGEPPRPEMESRSQTDKIHLRQAMRPYDTPKVLVIDDDRMVLALAEKTMSPIADVVTAETAEVGVKLVRGGSFDVVLFDVQLSEQNGVAAYDWPGNVRQLRAVIRRCVLDSSLPVNGPDVLPRNIQGKRNDSASRDTFDGATSGPSQIKRLIDQWLRENLTTIYSQATEYMERIVMLRVLRETGGNQSQAAKLLGITRGELCGRINTYNIVAESGVAIKDE